MDTPNSIQRPFLFTHALSLDKHVVQHTCGVSFLFWSPILQTKYKKYALFILGVIEHFLVANVTSPQTYRIIHKSLRKFRARLRNSQTDTAERGIKICRKSLQFSLCTRRRGVLAGFTARGSRDKTWRGQGIRMRYVS